MKDMLGIGWGNYTHNLAIANTAHGLHVSRLDLCVCGIMYNAHNDIILEWL